MKRKLKKIQNPEEVADSRQGQEIRGVKCRANLDKWRRMKSKEGKEGGRRR